jgi:HEPN domain-containing protein
MAPDEARAEDVRAWLRKAFLDLRAAEHDVSEAEATLWADVVFHAQQAAEKSLKALLAWHDVPFRKTHNLEELGGECLRLDGTLQAVVARAVPLTEYAWKFRYPGEPDEPSREEAAQALRIARDVFEAVATRLPADARPPSQGARAKRKK